jgi:hypothetical protein
MVDSLVVDKDMKYLGTALNNTDFTSVFTYANNYIQTVRRLWMTVLYTMYRLIYKVQRMNINYQWYSSKVLQFMFILESKRTKKEIQKPETLR